MSRPAPGPAAAPPLRPTPRGCGKQRYASRALALSALRALHRKRNGDDLGAYHCAACGAFHLGRSPKRRGPGVRFKVDHAGALARWRRLIEQGS